MKRYVFDPSRLAKSPKQLEREGYALAGRMLREQCDGDPLTEVRRRVQRDPVFRAMLATLADEMAAVAAACGDRLRVVKSGQP